ncbi:hypothetical protein [Lentzea sp. HUAS12]|uniref:hypothetical protein n=1 Tax=Lentzea sp. HUAS12 TaxID=2951806 RepID=UPI00209F7162|nr:hypothetical protein [Lentzea sp. HUAS12]USX56301.1 hypothetical protein ND450_20020 [Lentzea sp. HUAS12]
MLQKLKNRSIVAGLTLAAAVALVGAPGIAQAQSGSRICGNYWSSGSVLWVKVIEVPKSDWPACGRAVDRTNSVGTVPPEVWRRNPSGNWGSRQPIRMETCEKFSLGLLGNRFGGNVCNSMKRANNVFEVNQRTISTFWY